VNVLVWHVHGSWTTSFVQGPHTYLVPTTSGRGPEGRGRARTWEWPANAVEVSPAELAEHDVDVVVVQRPEEERWAREWTGRQLPTVWVEHNAPQGRIAELRHPAADRDDVLLVHVTHTNALFWDSGSTPVAVIEHGIADPGLRFTGELRRAAVVVNEPLRRGRVVGADLLAGLAQSAPIDLFGMGAEDWVHDNPDAAVTAFEDLPQHLLHAELAARRLYLHPFRWTSLGLSLVEAMHLGMPVAAFATTDAPEAVPREAGIVTNRLDVLAAAIRLLVDDVELARQMGLAAREAALERYGLARFLADWDDVLARTVQSRARA
jgi:hypothetical protein